MSQSEAWRFDEDPEVLYERYLVPSKFGPWAEDLVALGAPQLGERVLDVACGTGVVTRLVAPKVGPTGQVVGLDLNPGRLAVAKSISSVVGVDMKWREGNVSAMPLADASFDLICCQQGFQFFPDRLAATSEMFRVLVPGGRLALNVWQSIEHQPGAFAMAKALEHHVSAEAGVFRHTPFALGDANAIRTPMQEAGFQNIIIRPTAKTVRFPSAEAFTKRYICGVGGLARLVAQADDKARAALIEEMTGALQPYIDGEGLALPTATHLITARKRMT